MTVSRTNVTRFRLTALRPHSGRMLGACLRLPAAILLLGIRIYQRTVAPLLPVVTVGACGCRFSPTCSHYAAEAIRTHGAVGGVFLAAARLVKCTPLHPGGFDPVPPRHAGPRCARVGL